MINITNTFQNYNKPLIYLLEMEVNVPYANRKKETRSTIYRYVGQATNGASRIQQHIGLLHKGTFNSVKYFQEAFNSGNKLEIYLLEDINAIQSQLKEKELLNFFETYYISITDCQNAQLTNIDFFIQNKHLLNTFNLEYIPSCKTVYKNLENKVHHLIKAPRFLELELSNKINGSTYMYMHLLHTKKKVIYKCDEYLNIYLDNHLLYLREEDGIVKQNPMFARGIAGELRSFGLTHSIVKEAGRKNVSIKQATIALQLKKILDYDNYTWRTKASQVLGSDHLDSRIQNLDLDILNKYFI